MDVGSMLSSGRLSGGFWADIINVMLDLGEQGAAGVRETLLEAESAMENFFNELPSIITEIVDGIMRTAFEGGLGAMFIEMLPELVTSIWEGFIKIFPDLTRSAIASILEAIGVDPDAATKAGDTIADIFNPIGGIARAISEGQDQNLNFAGSGEL